MKNVCLLVIWLTAAAVGSAEIVTKTIPWNGREIMFKSVVNGQEYRAATTLEEIHKVGGTDVVNSGTATHQQLKRREPKGGVTLGKALEIAQREAERILGDQVFGKEQRWLLDQAKRAAEGKDSNYSNYYRFSYKPRRGASEDEGYLQIVVMLDGTLIPLEKWNPEPADGR